MILIHSFLGKQCKPIQSGCIYKPPLIHTYKVQHINFINMVEYTNLGGVVIN